MLEIPNNPKWLSTRPGYQSAQVKLFREMRRYPPTFIDPESTPESFQAVLWENARPDLVHGKIEAKDICILLPTISGLVRLEPSGEEDVASISSLPQLLNILNPQERILFIQTSCAGALKEITRQIKALPEDKIDDRIHLQTLCNRMEEYYEIWIDECLCSMTA
ncbi:hypothetical protein HYZ99_04575 [Candidatus Peregrinibacteria bacterium]|nr:hypothetical protein [Candidatus Peregrinibacteria bacterium]